MKYAKRFVAALLAVLMLAALLAVPGMAEENEDPNPNPNSTTDQDPNPVPVTYGTVQFDLTSLGLKETLTVQDEDYPNPAVTYTLKLEKMRVFQQGMHYMSSNTALMNSDTALKFAPSDATITAAKEALDGKTLATVTFDAGVIGGGGTTSESETKVYTEASGILAAINTLTFDRPCIIYWPVIKEFKFTDTETDFTDTETDHLSNYDHNKETDGTTGTVMVLRVDDSRTVDEAGKEILTTTLGFQAAEKIDLWNLAVMNYLSRELGDCVLDELYYNYGVENLWCADDFAAFWDQATLEEVINRFNIEYYFEGEYVNPNDYLGVLPFERLLKYFDDSDECDYSHDEFLEWYLLEGEGFDDFWAAADHDGTEEEVAAVVNRDKLAAYYVNHHNELETDDTSVYDLSDLLQYLRASNYPYFDGYLLNGNGKEGKLCFESFYPDGKLIPNSEPQEFPNGVKKADVVAVLDGSKSLYDFYLEYPSEFPVHMYSFALEYDDANRDPATANTNYRNNFFSNFPYVFLASEDKIDEYEDEHFPTNTLDVTKIVEGTQGRKDQYFKFTVVLLVDREKQVTRADLAAWAEQLDFTGSANSVNTATPKYGELFIDAEDNKYDNLDPEIRIKLPNERNDNWFGNDEDNDYYTIKMPSSTKGWIEIDFWLKHGETFQIGNIPSDLHRFAAFERPSVAGDEVFEGDSKSYYLDGYLVSNKWRYTKDGTEETRLALDDNTWTGTGANDWPKFAADTTDDKLIFTNEKEASTPTGVLLQAAAPIAGMVLAAALGAVLLLSRKRRRGGGDA